MCGGVTWTPERYQEMYPEYTYIQYKNASEENAVLVVDEEDSDLCTRFDAILPDGENFGWDCEDDTKAFLESRGFTPTGLSNAHEANVPVAQGE